MSYQIIPKKDTPPEYDSKSVKIKYAEYYSFGGLYRDEEITEDVIAQMLCDIREGVDLYLFLDSDGEEDFLEVVSDGEWLSLGYCFDGGETICYSYNPDYAEYLENDDLLYRERYAPIESGGQSPIEKFTAIKDIKAGVRAVEYFIRTAQRDPRIDWVQQL